MRGRIVREDQRVLVLGMLEEIKDSFFFHQAGDEVEIGLAVLDAVLARNEVAVKPEREIRKPSLFEDLLDDIGCFLLLKNPAVARAG